MRVGVAVDELPRAVLAPEDLGDQLELVIHGLLFTVNDTEAAWRGWQITKAHGGLGRGYRDPRFDKLAECRMCRGTGRSAGRGTAG